MRLYRFADLVVPLNYYGHVRGFEFFMIGTSCLFKKKSFCFSTDLYFVLLLSFNEANNFSIDYVTSTDEKITTEPHDLYFWGIRQNYSLSRIYTTGTV